jgi:hypothetical protein
LKKEKTSEYKAESSRVFRIANHSHFFYDWRAFVRIGGIELRDRQALPHYLHAVRIGVNKHFYASTPYYEDFSRLEEKVKDRKNQKAQKQRRSK